jgi:hypothetical protein
MGHSDIRTTLNLYAHLYDEHDQVVADALEARLEADRNRENVIPFEKKARPS